MKTSNKILLITGSILLIGMLCITYKVKSRIMSKVVVGNGVLIEKTYTLDEMNNIRIHGLETEFIPSNKNKAVVNIDENLQYITDVNNKNGNVSIKLKGDSIYNFSNGTKVKLYSRNLDSINIHYANCKGELMDSTLYVKLSGSSDAKFKFMGSILDVVCTNSSDLDLNGSFDLLNVKLANSSDLVLKGSCESFNAKLANSSDLNAKEFEVDFCSVKAVNSSDAVVNVSKELNVELANSSDLEYYGEAVLKKVETKNSSKIIKGNL